MDYTGKRVLLLDGFGRQIPSILHQLHGLGCIVTTMNESKLDVGCSSHYPKKKICVKGIRDDLKIYKSAIEQELASNNYDIVFPMLERSTDILYELKKEGKLENIKLIAAPFEAFIKAYDKQATMTACMENGVPCPITKLDTETLDEYLEKVNFPLACKPRKGSGSAGFKKVESKEELDGYIADGVIVAEDYVIQEFISQTEHMFNCYVFMDDSHEAMFTLPVETSRWYPVNGGPGCFALTVDRPDISEYAVKLFKAINWSGMGQVSFILDPRDSTPKVLEINGRISAGIKMTEFAGCTPVKYMFDRAYGEKMTPISFTPKSGLGLRYFHTDIMWLLKSKNRFNTEPSWFNFRHNRDYIFSWADPIPFFSYAIEHIMTYKKDMEKRKH